MRGSRSAETGICHCHATQATNAGGGDHRLSLADQVRQA
jgi:hypothetical protein